MKPNISARIQILIWMTVCGTTTALAFTPVDEDKAPDTQSEASVEEQVNFGRDIQPLLSDRCYLCHGPDEAARQAGLRLDNFADATESSIVPGDADGSPIIARMTSDDDDFRMPTPTSHKDSLTAQQVDLFRKWINQGARYEGHWAFQNPVEPSVPTVAGQDDGLHPIDAFIQQKLADKGIAPAKRANRPALLRRASFDLTGLPPTPQQVKAFVEDSNPDQQAWSLALDKLMESAHYGEHQARMWLDTRRHATAKAGDRLLPQPSDHD